ncbi:MAG: hypothetical protein DVB22_001379 [Verrucomicrobia bacterium]|nr:MAG: hypothetical protein DVB22_001379 [Verrucomicrobiota bacterium]
MNRFSSAVFSGLLATASLVIADGDTGTPPPAALTYSRHMAATSGIHDPRSSYTHLPVISGRPVSDSPLIICTASGCDILTWLYPGLSLSVALQPVAEAEEAGGPSGTSPVPPPTLADGCWQLYDSCGFPFYQSWLSSSAALLGLAPSNLLPDADPDGEGITNAREAFLRMHPFDHRSGFSLSPNWLLTPSDPPAVTVEFAGLSGRVYALEWSPDLSPGSWQTVQTPFLTPAPVDEDTDIGEDRYLIYSLTADLPPETSGLSRYFLRMTAPDGMDESAAVAGSGPGAAAARFFLVPPPDEHATENSPFQPARQLRGRFFTPRNLSDATITLNNNYVLNPANGPTAQPIALPDSFDLNDPVRVFDALFSSLPSSVQVYPTENYFYWSIRIGQRTFRGNLNLSVRTRDISRLPFYYSELADISSGGQPHRVQIVGGGTLGPTILTLRRDPQNPLRYLLSRGSRTVTFDLHNLTQAPPPQGVLRPGEIFVERTFDESGLRFLLVFQPSSQTRPATFTWLLDPGPWDAPFTAPSPDEFKELPNAPGNFLHTRTGFAFAADSRTLASARRLVLIAVTNDHVASNTWFDGPGDQLADNFDPVPLKPLLLAAFPDLTPDRIDNFGYLTDSSGTERIGLYPYHGYDAESDLSAFALSLRPTPDTDPDTLALWNTTINAIPPAVPPPPVAFAFNEGGAAQLPDNLMGSGLSRDQVSGSLTVQSAEPWQTPTFPEVWITKSQKGSVVRIHAPGDRRASLAAEYLTAPQAVHTSPDAPYPWRDGFSPFPTAVAVDPWGECWIANTGDNVAINGSRMGSVTRIGLALGGTRCRSDGSPDPTGGFLKPPFDYLSPSVTDRDGDGLLRTSSGPSPLPWPGNSDVISLDGSVKDAIDELITGYVRIPITSVASLTFRNGLLWAGSPPLNAWCLINPMSARPLTPPVRTTGAEAGIASPLHDLFWTLGNGRTSIHVFPPDRPNLPVFKESLDPALGPAASHGSAIAPWLNPDPATKGIWIASRHPNLPNELSLATTSPRSLSRLVLKGPNVLSSGITALTQLTPIPGPQNSLVALTESCLPESPDPATVPPANGSLWLANPDRNSVRFIPIPGNPDIPGPFNHGLIGLAQGRNRDLWLADFLGHRALRIDDSGNLTDALPLYSKNDLADAATKAASTGSDNPFHLLAGPWTTGDLTGLNPSSQRNSAVLVITTDARHPDYQWQSVTWKGQNLAPGSISALARASNNPLAPPTPLHRISPGQPLKGTIGRFLQIYLTLSHPIGSPPPSLSSLTAR